jgi:hypothetical protein
MVGRSAIGQLRMDEQQELLQHGTALLPIGVPNGLDEAPRSLRYGRQTRQVQQRIGHADQTPMFPNGFGTPHAILIEAQLPLAVLIEGFDLPPCFIYGRHRGGGQMQCIGPAHIVVAGLRVTVPHPPEGVRVGMAIFPSQDDVMV